jgi:hypothetical protein
MIMMDKIPKYILKKEVVCSVISYSGNTISIYVTKQVLRKCNKH